MQRDGYQPSSPLELLLGEQAQGSTGVVFVSTSDRRQVRIALDNGRIVHIGFGNRRGGAALQSAAMSTGVSATFMPGKLESVDDDLPPERALLAVLAPMLSGTVRNSGFRDTGADSTGTPTVPPTGAPTSPRTFPPASRGIDRAQVAQVRTALVEVVGPMAEVLVDEQLAAGVQDIDVLIERLTEQVGGARAAKEFAAALARRRR